jgi:hypothetical protein
MRFAMLNLRSGDMSGRSDKARFAGTFARCQNAVSNLMHRLFQQQPKVASTPIVGGSNLADAIGVKGCNIS